MAICIYVHTHHSIYFKGVCVFVFLRAHVEPFECIFKIYIFKYIYIPFKDIQRDVCFFKIYTQNMCVFLHILKDIFKRYMNFDMYVCICTCH